MNKKRTLSLLCAAALILGGCNGESAPSETDETTAPSGSEGSGAESPEPASTDDLSASYEWGNVEIVGGGYVVGFYYNKAEEGLVYARTDIGGAYRMDRETGRWVPLTDRFNEDDYTYYGIDGLAVDETEPNRVYLLAGMYRGWKSAVLRSEDYGETWEITPLEFSCGGNEPNRYADRLMVDPNDPATLYVGSRTAGLWVSHDYGASFSLVDSFPTLGLDYKEDGYNFGITAIAFDPDSSAAGEACRTIYVGTGDRMSYVTTDGGATWAEIPDHPNGYLPCHIYVQDGKVYFVFNSQAGPYQVAQGAIRRYDPATKEWTDLTPNDSGHGWGDLEIDPSDPNTLYLSTMGKWGAEENDNIYRSTDGGASWEGLFTGDGKDRIFAVDYSGAKWLDWGSDHAKLGWMIGDLEVNPFNRDELIYGTGATTYRSTNLTKWGEETINIEVYCAGIEETAVQDVTAANSDEIRLYSAMGDIDGFTHYDVDVAPDTMNEDGAFTTSHSISCGYLDPEIVVRTGEGNLAISISTDGGKTWKQSRKPVKGGDCGTAAVNADGSAIYWTNSSAAAVFRSDDLGETWIQLDKALANPQLAADCLDPDALFAYTGGTLYISRDRGESFEMSGLFIPDGGHITPSPEKAGDLWLATSYGGVFLVTEYGQGELIRKNIQSAECVAVGAASAEGEPMALYAIGINNEVYGVWRSTDSGESWQRINDDDHQFGVIGESIAADYRVFGQVYFGTNGRGIIMGRLK
ncbi:MAG: hypothetical protein NC084_04595 [Bacteroides sp.]|nr:cellulose-binding protein [Eubacterium sp.]MCM1418672.1 cellulose-binding protein [Roseburia sp.]MCM1461976.1 hypothetical protein [Bacteroides sp.]